MTIYNSESQLSPQDARRVAAAFAQRHLERLLDFNREHPRTGAEELLMPLDDSALEAFTEAFYIILIDRNTVVPTDAELRGRLEIPWLTGSSAG